MPSKKETLKIDGTAGHERPDISERRRAEETLRKSEELYRVLFTSSRDAIMILEPPAWNFTSGNPACVEMFRTGDEKRFVLTAPWDFSPKNQPDGRPSSEAALAMIQTALQRGSHFFEWRHRRLDGEEFPATVLLTRVDLEGHSFLQATVRDITGQKRAELRIEQFDRARAVLGGIDHAIVHIHDQQKLLDEVCLIAVEKGGFKLAWVGMVGPDGSVQPVAKCGATGYLDGIRVVVAPDEPEGCGPIGTAIRENRPVAIKNINLDSRMDPWRERAIKFGLHYASVFPVRVRQKVAGSFQAYAPTVDFFDENGLALLAQMSDDISFALAAIADEKALKESEQQLRKLSQAVEQSPASIVITDLTGAIEYVNPTFTRLTGYTADEVIGRNPRMLKSGEMPAETYEQLWQTITQGQEWRGHFHNRKKNGELFWEVASISPIKTADGKITHFVAVKEDITGRRQVEQALRESEERFQLLANATYEGICISENGRICDVNDQMLKIFDCTRDEMVGKDIFNFVAPDSRTVVAEAISNDLEDIYEHQTRRKDGSLFYVETRARIMRVGNRKLRVAAMRDITGRKVAEKSVRENEERLEREVLGRIEMEQERIGRDLHDNLCQILVGAKYRTGVLEKLLSNQNVSSAVAEAKVVEQMLNRSIQQARDLAKGLNPVTLKAQGLVISLKELANEIEASGMARCRCQLSSTLIISDGDVVKHLYRITQEAVQNAVKHGKARSISINLHERAGTIVLSVEDDGVGFSANPQETVGAGLHNMRMRVLTIGGTLAIRPGQNGGTLVSVSLPAKRLKE